MSCGCTDPCQPNSIPCTCEARVTSDCVTVSGATSNCLAIDDNLLLTDYLTQMDERICEKVDSVTNFIALENVGTGSELYKGDSLLGKKQIRTVKSLDSALIVTETVDEIQLDLNLPAIIPPDGTETKLVSGTNTTVAGNGSIATPYSVNVSFPTPPDGSETKVIAGTNTTVTGLGTTVSPYVVNSTDTVADGSETKINAGTNVTVSGNGTTATPYIINSSGGVTVNDATSSIKGILRLTGDLGGTADAPTTPTAVHLTGSESISGSKSFLALLELTGATSGIAFNTSTSWTTNYAFPMLTRTGSLLTLRGSASGDSTRRGSMFDNNLLTTVDRTFTFPDKNGIFALTSDLNLQKEITTSTVILDIDNNHTIFINNGATPTTITINSSITAPNFCVGFIQEGTGDVTFVGTGVSLTNPVGLKSKGQGYATFIERKLNTSNYFLLGNVKS